MRTCESVGELAKELGVTQRCLYKWRTKLETVEAGEEASRPSTHALAHRKEILQLKRLLAEKDFADVSPELRAELLRFFSYPEIPSSAGLAEKERTRMKGEVERLQNAALAPAVTKNEGHQMSPK
jgi:hypothetical protein